MRATLDLGVVVELSGNPFERTKIVVLGRANMPLYMVVEHFRNGDAAPVYRRFREHGRMAPEGLQYISSWVDEGLSTCFQVMEAPDRSLLDEWMRNWADLVAFEVHPVMTSQEAARKVGA